MQRRAQSEYSLDPSTNVALFQQEVLGMDESSSNVADSQNHESYQLLRVWEWMERIQGLCRESKPLEGEDSSHHSLNNNNNNIDTTQQPEPVWSARGLVDAGTFRLLLASSSAGSSMGRSSSSQAPPPPPDAQSSLETKWCQAFHCTLYESPGRRLAWKALGWTPWQQDRNKQQGNDSPNNNNNNSNVETKSVTWQQDVQEWERAALLALWYGQWESAYTLVQRGVDAQQIQHTLNHDNEHYLFLNDVCNLVQRFCTTPIGLDPNDQSTCTRLLNQLETTTQSLSNSYSRAYLSALLHFVQPLPDFSTKCAQVLSNSKLSLVDRAAFACRFLPWEELKAYLQDCMKDCEARGNLEGIVLTGLDRYGFAIVQSMVDQTSDVQTASLISTRAGALPVSWTHERRLQREWVDSYRRLLNSWQLWQCRASFDVDRATLLKRQPRQQPVAPAVSNNNKARPLHAMTTSTTTTSPNKTHVLGGGPSVTSSRIKLQQPPPSRNHPGIRTQKQQQLQPAVSSPSAAGHPLLQGGGRMTRRTPPPATITRKSTTKPPSSSSIEDASGGSTSSLLLQLDPRCNFCSKPLLLRQTKDGSTIEKLSKMKQILSCCPNCRKPLPKCAVCMLPMGIVNPYMDLIRRMSSSSSSSLLLNSPSSHDTKDMTATADSTTTMPNAVPIAEWFTWCRRCKHGGHAHHMASWFATHSTCPVSGCDCPCHRLDQCPTSINNGDVGNATTMATTSGMMTSPPSMSCIPVPSTRTVQE